MDQEIITDEEAEEALKQFLLDIECLDEIVSTRGFNPFDVLRIARTEIRHSNVLAWLLDPSENHGFGARILSSLVSFVVKNDYVDNDTAIQFLTLQYPDVQVKREWQNIDILIESIQEEYVICIENKVDTQDHSNQLNKYYTTICKTDRYRNFKKIFLYLTPDGLFPREDEHHVWKVISYPDIIEMIDKESEKVNLSEDVSTFVYQYLDVLRRETMANIDVAETCKKIYLKHKQALDLLFEYRPDELQCVGEIFKQWCEEKQGEIEWDQHKSNKSYYRFRTKVMDNIIPPSDKKSQWNTFNHYYYEIGVSMNNDDIKYDIHFVVNSDRLSLEERKDLEDISKKLIKAQKNKKKSWKEEWAFITSVTSEKYTITPDGMRQENLDIIIKKNLDKAWDMVRNIVEGTLLDQQ